MNVHELLDVLDVLVEELVQDSLLLSVQLLRPVQLLLTSLSVHEALVVNLRPLAEREYGRKEAPTAWPSPKAGTNPATHSGNG